MFSLLKWSIGALIAYKNGFPAVSQSAHRGQFLNEEFHCPDLMLLSIHHPGGRHRDSCIPEGRKRVPLWGTPRECPQGPMGIGSEYHVGGAESIHGKVSRNSAVPSSSSPLCP